MKYFKIEEEKISLSTYKKRLEKQIDKKKSLSADKYDIYRIDYLIQLFGDIELEESIIKEFLGLYHTYGGRYSVRSSDETLLDLLEIKKEFPHLTSMAISDLSFYYIRDLFEEYDLKSMLSKMITVMGETDEMFDVYLTYVDKCGKEQQKRYIDLAKELSDHVLSLGYEKGFADHLSYLVRTKHLDSEELLDYLPETELVKKDSEQLQDLSRKTRIYFGVGKPISFELTTEMIKDPKLSDYPEELVYYVRLGDGEKKIPATFTKSEFIESTKVKKKVR